MFTTTHPIDFEEDMAKFKFSYFLNIFKGYFIFIALKSMVPGWALFINLHNKIPSSTNSNNFSWSFMGNIPFKDSSSSR